MKIQFSMTVPEFLFVMVQKLHFQKFQFLNGYQSSFLQIGADCAEAADDGAKGASAPTLRAAQLNM
jgi:hypothetical protein